MKVIGTSSSSTYICEVSHSELEKFMNRYYRNNGLKELEAGDVVDLGRGHDFARETADAIKKTEEFIKANKKIVETILNGFSFMGNVQAGSCEKELEGE